MGNESIRQYLQNEDHVVFSPFLDVPRKLYNSLPQRQALLAALKVKKAPTLEQLEKNISDQMRTLLASEQRPQVSCYIDVAEKPEQEDIMLFLFKCWIKETQPDVSFLLKLLTQRSFVVEKCKINSLQDYEDMLNICIKEYENAEEENEEKEGKRNLIYRFEGDTYKEIIGELLKKSNTTIFFFLDNVSLLSVSEQVRINDMLDRRLGLGKNAVVKPYLKINNGKGTRQTFYDSNERRREHPHDYYALSLPV